MDITRHPALVAGSPSPTGDWLSVRDKFTGETFAEVGLVDGAGMEAAIAGALASMPALARQRPHERATILHAVADEVLRRYEELARLLVREVGKPISAARTEVGRLANTFRIAAEEATRWGGELVPLERDAASGGRHALYRRCPVGPCSFVVPFNFPLNLAAHKIAPAIAVGCPFVLKPSPRTPLSALVLGEILARAGAPAGSFSIVPCRDDVAGQLVTDERIRLLSFTGSASVGWKLKALAGKKKVVLELGGNAACIVDAGANVAKAAARIAVGAFAQAGQSCISVQRAIVHESIYEDLRAALLREVEGLVVGDPNDEATFVGPLVSGDEAQRVDDWIREAVAAGARLLRGGKRRGSIVEPAVLEDVPDTCRLGCEEVFGPVVVLERFSDFGAALARVNESRYGLQAGIFSPSMENILRAWKELEVGGVIAGDIPTWRADGMTYGGVKDSGLGREGVRAAMEEFTEPRALVLEL